MKRKLTKADIARMACFLGRARDLLGSRQERAELPPLSHERLTLMFNSFQPLLEAARARGIFMNPWSMAGLKFNEVRTTQALASLWDPEIGGNTARQFFAKFLDGCGIDVTGEYLVRTEVNPLGLADDRVDMVIETSRHLVGIEVKISAGETKPNQLARYASALKKSAQSCDKDAVLILLAPFASPHADHCRTWQQVAKAARAVLPPRRQAYHHNHWLIAHFADHVIHH